MKLQQKRFSQKLMNTKFAKLALSALFITAMSACSGGGADVEENPVTPPTDESNYSGPPPADADVQQFKLAVWDNLSPSNRCGECHGNGQVPDFVNLTDINLAYAAAKTIVDFDRPAESRMVTKVGGGHNCWLSSDSACADTITNYIISWIGTSSSSGNQIQLQAPTIREPGDSKSFPEASDLFGTTIYPLLSQYCAGCHNENAANPIAPFFANADIDSAYAAAKARINLDTPENSRFVERLRNEFHNCWGDCTANSTEMENAIRSFADQIPLTQVDPALLTSKSLFLTDGIVASGGGRHDVNIIALWNFKTGTGSTAFDTSGIEPAINLTLSGSYNWVGGWGIQIVDGKAQGSTSNSKKLNDLIKATGEYSIEAWVAPANVTQEGPAGIVSYSAGTTARNFTLGQTLYNYEFLNRSSETNENGDASLSTPNDDEIVQTALQHVVATFSPIDGRKIFVNGELVAEEDVETGGTLNDWDDTFAVVMGNEVSSDRLWQGTLRMVAIHNRALTVEQVVQNFDVGVGEKFFMLFSISDLIDLPESYIVYEVSQWDSYGYLFDKPFFVNLDGAALPSDIDIEKIRIAVNGKEVKNGQAYKNMAMSLNTTDYDLETGQQTMSRLGTVIALEKGPTADEFFLTFEKIGASENPFVEPPAPTPATPADLDPRPEIGVRDFFEIHATMAKATGISMAQTEVAQTYELVKQQMPTLTDIDFFSSAHQMGVTQLAISYCNALVEDTSARAAYFSGVDFNAAAGSYFTPANRALVFDPLLTNIMGTNLASQPLTADVETELGALTDKLTACGGSCAGDRTETVVKAVCAAALGSAAMLVQ